MSDTTTIARPYAKAIFEHALAVNQLTEWSGVLQRLAYVVLSPDAERFIGDPTVSVTQQAQLLQSVVLQKEQTVDPRALENFIVLLAVNSRLRALPEIYAQYDALRAEQEKTLVVCVRSFSALTRAQEQHLMKSLSRRLARHVTLETSIDKSLLGGAVIQAGDLVIDGSVRTMLTKLHTHLAA